MNETCSRIPPLPKRNHGSKKYPWELLLSQGYFEFPFGAEGYKVTMRRITNAAISKGVKITCRSNIAAGYIGVWKRAAI